MKDTTDKAKDSTKSNFPRKLKIANKIKTGQDEIGNEFNKYFVDTGPSLGKNIPNRTIPSESFLKRVNITLTSQSLSISELKDVFFFSENKQKSCCCEINFNVIKHCFGELCVPLKYLFDSSLQNGLFLDLMIIAIVSPAFKTGNTAGTGNYRPISVFLFSGKSLNA